jgi:PAS domain S-box-containing protein
MLNSSFPMFIWWDKNELTNFYNDAYAEILGGKHPVALGQSANETWPDIWDDIGPLATKVFKTGKPVFMKNLRLDMKRHGHDEETYFTFSYSPLRSEDGTVAGLFCAVTETTEDVLARQQLEESEARFRNLADTAPMFIAMADTSGNAVYFNKPWLEFTGKKLSEMKGLGWLSTLHPEDAPKFERDFKDAFSKQIPIREEYRFKRADGEYRWMLAVGAPRFTPDRHFSGYFGTYTDFHELKEAQFKMQQSEERFRTLIEKSADAVQLVSSNGEILFSSDSVKNVLGYTPEELAHEGVTPYLHPDDREYFFTNFNDLIQRPGEQITMQYRVKHKDGSWAWLETVGVNHLDTPNINALVGNFRNITAQKIAETELRSSEERFRALAENIPNLAWMADATGYVYWYNSRWYEYTGTTQKIMQGEGWQSIHDPEYLPRILKQWNHSIKNRTPFEMVFPMKGADGIYRPFLTRAVPIYSDDDHQLKQWVGTSTDISEQLKIKQTEARNEELETIAKQLALQRKELLSLNKAKDEFIGMASHQLRTPATAVKQYIGLLMDGIAGPVGPEQFQFLKTAYDSNERELGIINDLLKTAQIDSTEYTLNQKPHDIVKLLQEAIAHTKPAFTMRKQEITFEAPGGSINVMVDATEIELVFVNLLENASKYSHPGTKSQVIVKQKDHHVEIAFIDKGVGINKEDQKRVFDKFTRSDNELSDTVSGTGLGLYWVRQLVELHGGTVTLTSTPGKGSKFTVRLPL